MVKTWLHWSFVLTWQPLVGLNCGCEVWQRCGVVATESTAPCCLGASLLMCLLHTLCNKHLRLTFDIDNHISFKMLSILKCTIILWTIMKKFAVKLWYTVDFLKHLYFRDVKIGNKDVLGFMNHSNYKCGLTLGLRFQYPNQSTLFSHLLVRFQLCWLENG